jgi:DNA polymerase-3 subunit beta
VVGGGRDDTLPVLTGVQLDVEGPTITLAATDRYRFAVRTLRWQPDGADWNGRALLPAKALLETAKALAADDTISLTLADEDSGGSGVTGLTGDTQRTTLRGLEGKLPSYDTLFPTEFAAEAVVPTEALADIVKRVALVAERSTPVRLAFTPGTVTIEAGSSDDAQAVDRADADYTDHTGGEFPTFRIAFNPHFLLDGLTALGSDAVRIRFTNPHRPVLLSGDGAPETGLKYLLMPVRLSG